MKLKKTNVNRFAPMVDFIADAVGPFCEVVLHDFSNPEGSIVKIRNGHVTRRKVGGTLSPEFLELFQELDRRPNPPLTLSRASYTKDGKLLKGSCLIIRNRKRTIGILSINIDLAPFCAISEALDGLFPSLSKQERETDDIKLKENFSSNFQSLLEELLQKSLNESERLPEGMNKEEKLAVIRALDNKGAFLIRGAVREISRRLGLSQPTIYKYLSEYRESTIVAKNVLNDTFDRNKGIRTPALEITAARPAPL